MRTPSAFRSWVTSIFTSNNTGAISGPQVAEGFTEIADRFDSIAAVQLDTNGRLGIGTATPNAKLDVIGQIKSYTSQNSASATIAQQGVGGGTAGLMISGGANGNAAFMEFHVPGIAIWQLGLDIDNQFVLRPWGVGVTYPLLANGYNNSLATNNSLGNKKLVLYDTIGNTHQFLGLGVNGGTLRYQVSALTDNHIFYAATSATTSDEVMRISGKGVVSLRGLRATGSSPVVAPAGTMGVNGSVSILAGATDLRGRVALATVSAVGGSQDVLNFQFVNPQADTNYEVVFQAASPSAADLTARIYVNARYTTGFSIALGSTGLPAGNNWTFTYLIIG